MQIFIIYYFFTKKKIHCRRISEANSFHARPIGGRGAKIGALLFIAPSSIESDGARMTEECQAVSSDRQTKGKINGIPPEFREAAADKCFRD